VAISGDATVATGEGDVDMDTVTITATGKLDLDTGAGDVTVGQNDGTDSDNTIFVDGKAEITSGTGTVELNKVRVGTEGWLEVTTGSDDTTGNDVITDAVFIDGRVNITNTNGDLLMADSESRTVLGENFNEAASTFDIGGDIGAADQYYKIGFLEGIEKDSLTLNIVNADSIFLTQVTDLETEFPDLPHNGRLEGEDEKSDHEEAIGDMAGEDKIIQIPIPEQSAQDMAQQLLGTEQLTHEQIMQLIGGKLTGADLQLLLEITGETIESVVANISAMNES